MAKGKFFTYGWFMVAVAWVCYGFGISPAYYSISRFAASFTAELDLTREQYGIVFGVFTLFYSCVGIFVGPAMARWGVRAVMVCGFVTTSIGFFYFSRADSLWESIIGFSILGGTGIGFATIVPCQTIGQNWFLKRRALAIALIFTAGGIVGKGVPYFDTYMIEHYDWRAGWVVIACISAFLAVFAALLIRDTPEMVGHRRDGATAEEEEATLNALLKTTDGAATQQWTGKQAMKTPQFFMMIFCGVAYAVPWGIITSHFVFHMQELGFTPKIAGEFLGTMALISIGGRLAGAGSDYVPPQVMLAVSLVLEGIGAGIFIIADTTALAYLSITLVGLGFGTAYISVPVIFSHFFGRQAFGVTSGVRITITGVFNAAGPIIAGRIFDRTGAYTIPLIGLIVLCLVGSICAALLRHPGAPPEIAD